MVHALHQMFQSNNTDQKNARSNAKNEFLSFNELRMLFLGCWRFSTASVQLSRRSDQNKRFTEAQIRFRCDYMDDNIVAGGIFLLSNLVDSVSSATVAKLLQIGFN